MTRRLIPRSIDVTVERDGSLFLLRPQNRRGRRWIEKNVDPDAMWFGSALVVEPRYVVDVAEGMLNDGLEVRS